MNQESSNRNRDIEILETRVRKLESELIMERQARYNIEKQFSELCWRIQEMEKYLDMVIPVQQQQQQQH